MLFLFTPFLTTDVHSVQMRENAVQYTEGALALSERQSLVRTRGMIDIHHGIEQVQNMAGFQQNKPDFWDEVLNSSAAKSFLKVLSEQGDAWLDSLKKLLLSLRVPLAEFLPVQMQHVFSMMLMGLMLALVLFLSYLLLGFFTRGRGRGRPSDNHQRLTDGSHPSRLQARQAYEGQASWYSKQRDYQHAIHQLYLASLCLLNERQWLTVEEAQTNQDIVEKATLAARTFSSKEDAHSLRPIEHLVSIVTVFESSYFGSREVEAHSFEQCWLQYHQLCEMVYDAVE